MDENNKKDALIKMGDISKEISFEKNEDSLWKQVGDFIRENVDDFLEGEDPLYVETEDGIVKLSLTGDMGHPLRKEGSIPLKKVEYKDRYMSKVDPETNQYEFYKIIPNTMGNLSLDIGGSYGRIGAGDRDLGGKTIISPPFNSCLYWPVYNLLLSKGYEDMSDLVEDDEDAEVEELNDEDPTAALLWDELHNASAELVSEFMDFDLDGPGSNKITRRLINSCELCIKKMELAAEAGDFETFVKELTKLLALSKRRIDKYHGMTVESYLPRKVDDPEKQFQIFQEVLEREKELVLAMKAMVGPEKSKEGCPRVSPFGDVGVRMPTEDEIDEVNKMVEYNEGIAPGDKDIIVDQIFRILPGDQKKRFEECLASRKNKKTRLLWHGAGNGAVCSIVQNSLQLSYANNGMFSKANNGIYLASDARKSAGYTNGGRWNNGERTNVYYLMIFEAVVSSPWYVTSTGHYTRADIEAHGADHIHARRAVCGLYRDEFIFPYEEALCMKYLVRCREE